LSRSSQVRDLVVAVKPEGEGEFVRVRLEKRGHGFVVTQQVQV
jgi:hypothetical protein